MLCAGADCRMLAQSKLPEASAIPTVEGTAGPRLIKRVNPVFPGIALTDQVNGDVTMTVTVGTDGMVKDIKVVHGLPQLIRPAVHAVSQWQYEPYRVNGVVTAVKTTVTVHYTVAPNSIGVADSAARGVGVTFANPNVRTPLPPPPDGVMRISSRVMANMLDKKIDPVYPADSIALDARGTVVLLATIRKTGKVSEVQVVSGPERFRDAATDAVKQWHYRPYLIEGEAVDVQTTITLSFVPPPH